MAGIESASVRGAFLICDHLFRLGLLAGKPICLDMIVPPLCYPSDERDSYKIRAVP